MKTSSDNRAPVPSGPNDEHWSALMALLPEAEMAKLDTWMDEQLAELEESHASFVTPRSLRQNLRSSRDE